MEMSVRFIDEQVSEEFSGNPDYSCDNSTAGKVFVPVDGVIIEGPIGIRYERRPWIEQFELDGIKAAPPRRKGVGNKDLKGFVKSLSTIYAKAYDDYNAIGDDANVYFGHVAEYFTKTYENPQMRKLFDKFSGLTENMWREGNLEMLDAAMQMIIPIMRRKAEIWERFQMGITEEFKSYIENEGKGE